MNALYYDIQEYIRDNVQKARNLKKVYMGVPPSGEVPRSNLPCIVIMPESQENIARSVGGNDTQTDTASFMVMASTQDYKQFDDEEQPYLQELYNIIDERESDGDYRDDTLLGTLRKNNVLAGRTTFIDNFRIEWGFDDSNDNPKIIVILTATITSLPQRPL